MTMKLFRYTDGFYHKPFLDGYDTISETKCGYWIEYWNPKGMRWIPKERPDYHNIFAFDTRTKALNNYIKRKEKQIQILVARLDETTKRLKIARQLNPDKIELLPLPRSSF